MQDIPVDAVRVGPVAALPDVLKELAVEPRRVFTKARVRLSAFRDPETMVPFEKLGRLFQYAEDLSGCHHIGLKVGERFTMHSLGVLGELMRNSKSVGEGLRELLLHLHLYDRGAVPVLVFPEPTIAMLGYSIYRYKTPGIAQMYAAAVTIGFRILQALSGPRWLPTEVHLSFTRPADIHPYRRVFGVSPRFDTESSGVVFRSSLLAQPIAGANPILHRVLSKALAQTESDRQEGFDQQVRQVLRQAVLGGTASAATLASIFGVTERTLRKRLYVHGSGFQQLLDETRSELARQLLQDTRMPISEIADALHFADPAIFSRAFRSWLGVTPTQFRRSVRTASSALAPSTKPNQMTRKSM